MSNLNNNDYITSEDAEFIKGMMGEHLMFSHREFKFNFIFASNTKDKEIRYIEGIIRCLNMTDRLKFNLSVLSSLYSKIDKYTTIHEVRKYFKELKKYVYFCSNYEIDFLHKEFKTIKKELEDFIRCVEYLFKYSNIYFHI